MRNEDSDGSDSSDDPTELPEWIDVDLQLLRDDVKCAICLGILKNTRTVMECMHRFCKECIDKSMRLGNNECPACRTHCASRRSLRDDSRYDKLIKILYNDVEKYEEEEHAFHENEENRNKQFHESIAQISRRQSEAVVTKSRKRKDEVLAKCCSSHENEDENNHKDENEAEIIKSSGYNRKERTQSSPTTANAVLREIENDLVANRGSKGGPVWTPERLVWGRSATRNKTPRKRSSMKLARYLESRKDNDAELGVHLMLTCLDHMYTPNLQRLYLSCPPHFSVDNLKEHVAEETLLPTEDIEIVLVKEQEKLSENNTSDPQLLVENHGEVLLDGNETLAGVRENYAQEHNDMVLAYRIKERD